MKKAFLPLLLALIGVGLFFDSMSSRRAATGNHKAIAPPAAAAAISPALQLAPPEIPATAADPAGAIVPSAPAPMASKLEQLPKSEQESLQYAIFSAMHAIEPLTETEAAMEQNKGVSHFATNPRQKFQARFLEEGGVRLSSSREGKTWQAELRLTGRTEIKTWQVQGTRAERQSRPDVTEWYENRRDGLEHGFTVAQRPNNAGRTSFSVDLDVSGLGVEADRTKPGDLVFTDPEKNTPVLAYRDMKVQDATGRPLTASMSPTGSGLRFTVQDEEAVYPVTIDPLIASLEAELKAVSQLTASDGAPHNGFGYSVALSGDTAIMGWNYDENSTPWNFPETAYVFVRSGSVWTQQAKLKAGDSTTGDYFGSAVALSGDTALIGARYKNTPAGVSAGVAYVFVRSGSFWTQQARLTAPDGAAGDWFGNAAAVSGDTALIGAQYKATQAGASAGAAYVFVHSGGVWTQQATLTAADSAADDYFGFSLALSGETALIGAYSKNTPEGVNAGAAYVFVRSGSVWGQQAKVTASDGAAGDAFGYSVALSGETALIGAMFKAAPAGLRAGAAYVFVRNGSLWTQQAKLTASDGAADDYFGEAVALSGDTSLIGAPWKDVLTEDKAGAAYVFGRSGAIWTQQARLTASDGTSNDRFGWSVALSGENALIGAPYEETPAGPGVGAAYFYTLPQFREGDHYGISVDVDGDAAVVGALDHDTASASSAGAAWALRRTGTVWQPEARLTEAAPLANDRFGVAVAISGNRLAVGADYANAIGKTDCGSVNVFDYLNGTWIRRVRFTDAVSYAGLGRSVAVDGSWVLSGATLANGGAGECHAWRDTNPGGSPSWSHMVIAPSSPESGANFGFSVAVSNDRAIIGEPGRTGTFLGLPRDNAGRISLYELFPSPGVALAYTNASSTAQQGLGFSVAMEGNTAVAGGTSPGGWFTGSGSSAAGIVRAYVRDGGVWNYLTTLDTTGLTAANYFGSSVSVSNGVIAVGAFGSGGTPGRVRLYRQSGSTWLFQNEYFAPGEDSGATDAFGLSHALSGDTLLVGAYGVDAATGAAYVYRVTDPFVTLPELHSTLSGGFILLSWPPGTGLALWMSPTMTPGSWTKADGSEGSSSLSYPLTAPRMFFKLGPP